MHDACRKNMAAAIGASSLLDVYSVDEITEILASIESFRVLKRIRFNFKVSSSNKLANTKPSSSFEAATKFGFVLRHVGLAHRNGLASNTTPDCTSRTCCF